MIVTAHAELRERELGKLASWTAALQRALESAAVPPDTATLAAALGITQLTVAAQRWLASDTDTALVSQLDDVIDDTAELAAHQECHPDPDAGPATSPPTVNHRHDEPAPKFY